jgi:hypothetical protein
MQPQTVGQGVSGQCRLIELGFRQGGPAGYGLQLFDRDRPSLLLLHLLELEQGRGRGRGFLRPFYHY